MTAPSAAASDPVEPLNRLRSNFERLRGLRLRVSLISFRSTETSSLALARALGRTAGRLGYAAAMPDGSALFLCLASRALDPRSRAESERLLLHRITEGLEHALPDLTQPLETNALHCWMDEVSDAAHAIAALAGTVSPDRAGATRSAHSTTPGGRR